MAIIVEDGTNVDDANSYVTLLEVREFAEARGFTLPEDDSSVEFKIIIANDYLESLKFKGYKTNEVLNGEVYEAKTQALQWPRMLVFIEDNIEPLDEHSIPLKIKNAQCQLVVEQIVNKINLFPNSKGKFAIDERVGSLITKYSEKLGSDTSLTLTSVSSFLSEYLDNNGYRVRSVRI
jgi:hypothetical protein